MCSTRRNGGSHRWVAPFGDPGIQALVDSSSRLIAACRVLLRSTVPRHPPCALGCFVCTTKCFRTAILPRIALQLVRFIQGFCPEKEDCPRLNSQAFGCPAQKSPATTGRHFRKKGSCRCYNYLVGVTRHVGKTEVPSGTCHKVCYYIGMCVAVKSFIPTSAFTSPHLVGDSGLEPEASPLSEECSNQLS
jgi:hypothetical protein